MTNNELNNLAITNEDREYINPRFNFIIKQFQAIQEGFNNEDTHFADIVCSLPNVEHFYKRMSELLEIWYDCKKQERDKNYIKLNNIYLKKNSEIWSIDFENLQELPQKTICKENLTNDYNIQFYSNYKDANKARINLVIKDLENQINMMKSQL